MHNEGALRMTKTELKAKRQSLRLFRSKLPARLKCFPLKNNKVSSSKMEKMQNRRQFHMKKLAIESK